MKILDKMAIEYLVAVRVRTGTERSENCGNGSDTQPCLLQALDNFGRA